MGGIRSDVLALGAILGSAVVGGVATLALANGTGSADAKPVNVSVECTVSRVESAPRIVVTADGEARTIVAAPTVSVKSSPEACSEDVLVEIRGGDARAEEMEIRIEEARLRAQEMAVRAEHLAQERAAEALDRAAVAQERALEARERAMERARREVERAAERAERAERADHRRVRVIRLHGKDGVHELDMDHDFDFDFDDESMELDFDFSEIESAIRESLEGLENLDGLQELRGLQELESLDRLEVITEAEDLDPETRARVEAKMKQLKERLERLRRNG